jgi:glycosyltransferase involved in cell wall biosynthesis
MARRALLVVSRFPEVSQTFVVDHAQGLAQCGWEVHVAARVVDDDQLSAVSDRGFRPRVHQLTVVPKRAPLRRAAALASVTPRRWPLLRSVTLRSASYFAPSLRRLVAEIEPHLIHAHFAHNGLLAAMAGSGYPVIVNFHGYDVLEVAENTGWDPYRVLLEGCVGVVHSGFLEGRVRRQLSLPIHRVTLGVDATLFGGPPRTAGWSDPLRLLTVGRLTPQKGHHVAIEALALLEQRGLNAMLTIVGAGPEADTLRRLSRRHGVGDKVRFAGALPSPAVAEEMSQADLLLVPSIRYGGLEESFCRVAVEGMTSGLGVIGTTTGGLADTIGTGGWAIPPEAPDLLAAMIADIVASEDPAEVAARARERAARFSIETMRQEYATLSLALTEER